MDMKDGTQIILTTENGDQEAFFVIEETKINGTSYILVSETEDNGADAYIMKDISDVDSEEAIYEFVDDDKEVDYIGKIFTELLSEEEISLE